MIRFHIQADSDIPASTQLYNQIHFAIASRQYPPGHKLPSTRQLTMQTGLHRNTISKVYRLLEEDGVVEAQAGSGIYVRGGNDPRETAKSQRLRKQYPDIDQQIRDHIDTLLQQGCSLAEIRELFLAEVDWRLRCSASVLVTAPLQDLGAAELMYRELSQALGVPVEVVPLEELGAILKQKDSGTVVTSHYFFQDAEAITASLGTRTIALDLYDYREELSFLSQQKEGSCIGIVSISPGILRAAEIIIHSLRGEALLIMSCQPNDQTKLEAMLRSASVIICDQSSIDNVKQRVSAIRDDLIRLPRLLCSKSYISEASIALLKRELGLN